MGSDGSGFVSSGGLRLKGNGQRCTSCRGRRNIRMSVNLTREDGRKRIVITGLGVVSAFGQDVDGFYQHLLNGDSAISKVSGFDVEGWPTQFAAEIKPDVLNTDGYIAPKMKGRLDPFLTYTILVGKQALEAAGLGTETEDFKNLDKTRCGTLLGSGIGGVLTFREGMTKLLEKKRLSPFTIPYTITNMGSGLFAIDTGFCGPNYSISTACATGNFAINNAASHMMRGEADLMVCGGAEAAVDPLGLGGFVACRAMSTNNEDPQKASKPWDKNRDGFVLGEGAGAVVLETLEHALGRGANIIAEYLGGAQSCDAYHMTDPRKDGECVARCMEIALKDAQITPEDVQYINAHATSTPAGDLAEFRAVRSVFKGDVSNLRMNATKSLIGHGLGAAAGFEAVVLAKAIETGELHPTINIEDMEEEVDIDVVRDKSQKHEVNIGISNSFGFGGHNSTIIFGKYKE